MESTEEFFFSLFINSVDWKGKGGGEIGDREGQAGEEENSGEGQWWWDVEMGTEIRNV